MKKLILVSFQSFFCLCTLSVAAQNFSGFKKELAGHKIVSVTEQSSGPSASGKESQPPVTTSGGARITVGNGGQSFNVVSKTLGFKTDNAGVTKSMCSFNRIKTISKNPFGEFFVDTDNPFERPVQMEKMGQGYDNLIKEKCSYTIARGEVKMETGSAGFSDFWNQFNPYLTLDSMLNMIVFSVPGSVNPVKGTEWTDSAQNEYVKVKNSYTVLNADGATMQVKCSGVNIFAIDNANENSNAISLKVQRLSSTYTGIIEVNKTTGVITKADFEVITANRKNVMGQKIDSERKETVKVTNSLD